MELEAGVLIVDDWAMAPLTEAERRDLLEICDTRYQARGIEIVNQPFRFQWG